MSEKHVQDDSIIARVRLRQKLILMLHRGLLRENFVLGNSRNETAIRFDLLCVAPFDALCYRCFWREHIRSHPVIVRETHILFFSFWRTNLRRPRKTILPHAQKHSRMRGRTHQNLVPVAHPSRIRLVLVGSSAREKPPVEGARRWIPDR